MGASEKPYFVYMLRCSDGTFYSGIATDLVRRVVTHNRGIHGAKYTRARRPVTVVYFELCLGRGMAQKREHALKQLPRKEKEMLAKQWKVA